MTSPPADPETIDTIVRLAEEIARAAPDCAARAMQIAELARSLDGAPDDALIRDVLDTEILTDDFSDAATGNAASRVARALKD